MQLEDWTQLSALTGLTLRDARESHHGTLAAVLPRLTALQSLVLADDSHQGLPGAGAPACISGQDALVSIRPARIRSPGETSDETDI